MSTSPRRGKAALSLSMMMFLQYAVWGVWLPYLASYLQQPTEAQLITGTPELLQDLEGWLETTPALDLATKARVAPLMGAAQSAASDAVEARRPAGAAEDTDAAAMAVPETDRIAVAESLEAIAAALRAILPAEDAAPAAPAAVDEATAAALAEVAERADELATRASNLQYENFGLGFTGGQIGWILGLAGSIGAIFAPFIAGQVADRFLNAEIALGLLLVGGGIVKFMTAYATDYGTFMGLSILYSILYMPTLALTNSVAFANLDDAEKSFPRVRTWGTVGWIVASNAFPLIWLQTNIGLTSLPPFFDGDPKPNDVALIADCLKVSGILAVGYGLWAMFALPRTPPKKDVETPFAFVKAFSLLRHPGFLVATVVALPIAMIHQVYFIRTAPYLGSIGIEPAKIGPMMSIGQFSEIAFLAILGLFLKKLGYRLVLSLGCLAYALRFGLFSIATEATSTSAGLAAVAMVLHGLCYGFFFAGAYVYIERLAAADIRHSVQTVFGIIILGVGPVLAGVYNQWLDSFILEDGGIDYAGIWQVQALIGLACAIAMAIAFRPGLPADADVEPAAHGIPEAGGAMPTD